MFIQKKKKGCVLLVQGQAKDLDQAEELNSFEKYSRRKILKRLSKHKGEPLQAERKYFGRTIWTKICPVWRTSRRDMGRMRFDPFLLEWRHTSSTIQFLCCQR